MSERPSWMPTSGESGHLFFRSGSFHSDEEWAYAFDAFAKCLGIRAQIAVLQELLEKSEWIPVAYGAEDESKMIEAMELRLKIEELEELREELKNGM